ncbi:hypothetical protein DFW101_2330 [Solidesulfovibrio carbinoliphilus subsp. oakridgensis]|uniref:Uncharacterized protein n=1 Tax=Solidesulfovibrio carbinoliphilus subsp. oakridgensis TaxID=694327 RepID=G7QAZ3_9BACT|nr:hypothetical protein DFW101_2330 [Solidesulfovibrio carbinoliphilus subsp. oakridgensis]
MPGSSYWSRKHFKPAIDFFCGGFDFYPKHA